MYLLYVSKEVLILRINFVIVIVKCSFHSRDEGTSLYDFFELYRDGKYFTPYIKGTLSSHIVAVACGLVALAATLHISWNWLRS